MVGFGRLQGLGMEVIWGSPEAPEPFTSESYAGVLASPVCQGTGHAGTVRCRAVAPEGAAHHPDLLRF